MSEAVFSERRALHRQENLQHTRLPLYVELSVEFVRRWPRLRFDPLDPVTGQRMNLRRGVCSIEAGYCLDAPSRLPAGSTVFDDELYGIGCEVPAMQTFFDRE